MATFVDSDELLDNIHAAINNAEHYMLHETNLAPVVHAHWKDIRTDSFDGLDWGICSHFKNLLPVLPYCGFCGAKMDEEV